MDINKYNYLIELLSVNNLSDLDLQENEIVVRNSATPTSPEKIQQIRQLFLHVIQSSPTIEDAELHEEVEKLNLLKNKISFLEKLAVSPLQKALLPIAELNALMIEQKKSFNLALLKSTHKFSNITAVSSRIQQLGEKLLEMHTEEHLKDQIQFSLDRMDLTHHIDKNHPEISAKLNALSEIDKHHFFVSLFRESVKVDIFDHCLDMANDHLNLLNSITHDHRYDEATKKDLKKALFHDSNERDLIGLLQLTNEEQLKAILSLILKLQENESKDSHFTRKLVHSLLIEKADMLEGLQIITHFHTQHNQFPLISESIPIQEQIQLIKDEPDFYKQLHGLDKGIELLELKDLLFPLIKGLVHGLSVLPKETVVPFMNFFSTLNTKEKGDILKYFKTVSTSTVEEFNEVVKNVTTKKGAPPNWENGQTILEKHPHLIDPFEKWLGLGKNWPERIAELSPKMQEDLWTLFEIEGLAPDFFEKILEVSCKHPSLFSTLILYYSNFSPQSFIKFVSELETNPELIPHAISMFSTVTFENRKIANAVLMLDSETFSVILKDRYRSADIVSAYLTDPDTCRGFNKFQTNWKPYTFKAEKLHLLKKYPPLLEAAKKHGLDYIPWDEIPLEIWDKDADLPLKLVELNKKFGSDKISIRPLLWEAVNLGREATIYKLLDMQKNGTLNSELFQLFANPANTVLKPYLFLFLPEMPPAPIPIPFDGIADLTTTLKQVLFSMIRLGLADSSSCSDLSELLKKYPDPAFLQFVIETTKKVPTFPKFLNSIPEGPWTLNWNAKGHVVIHEWIEKYADKDPALFTHLLSLPFEEWMTEMIQNKPTQFFSMLEIDKKNSPPIGRFISPHFDLSYVEIAKEVGLKNFNPSHYKKLGSIYIQILKNSQQQEIDKIVSNEACLKALNKIGWKRLSKPDKFIDSILTMASKNEVSKLTDLLQWMEKTDYYYGERLFDLAKAGYIYESHFLAKEFEKESPDPIYFDLLKEANSIAGPKIQRIIAGLPELTPEILPPLPKQGNENIGALLKRIRKSSSQPPRVIETEFSVGLAEAMRTSSGQLSIITLPSALKMAAIPENSDYAQYLKGAIGVFATDARFSAMYNSIKVPDQNDPSAEMIRRMLSLPEDAVITDQHAQTVWLAAMLSRPRQSNQVGNCYASSWAIITQADKDKYLKVGADFKVILRNGHLSRYIHTPFEGIFEFPAVFLKKKRLLPYLDENLLLKARENTLSCMGALANKEVGLGLYLENLDYFNPSGLYAKKIRQSNKKKEVPIPEKVVLDEIKKAFFALAKVTVEYEEPHPVTKNLGWFQLAFRNEDRSISNFQDFQALQKEILLAARNNLLRLHASQADYITQLFDDLINFSQSPTSLADYVPASKTNPIETTVRTPWFRDNGGYPEAVISTDLQFIGEKYPFQRLQAKTPEEMMNHLYQYCATLPDNEKHSIIANPEKMFPLTVPLHALCFRPVDFLIEISRNRSSLDVITKLKTQPSGVRLSDFSPEQKNTWMQGLISILPQEIQKSFTDRIKLISWDDSIPFEDFGKKINDLITTIYKTPLPYDIRTKLEEHFLSLMSPQTLKSLPKMIVGDLNWDHGNYNNAFLVTMRSPLTGNLHWYSCEKNGANLRPISWDLHTNTWDLMEPISRMENGHLTTQKLA